MAKMRYVTQSMSLSGTIYYRQAGACCGQPTAVYTRFEVPINTRRPSDMKDGAKCRK